MSARAPIRRTEEIKRFPQSLEAERSVLALRAEKAIPYLTTGRGLKA